MNGRTSFVFVVIVLVVGCTTTREEARQEAAGLRLRAEERVACQEDCEQEWSRAEEWVKKHSGYAFPSEVLVTPERIEALRGARECDLGKPRLFRSVTCGTRPALASEPLGIGSGPMSDSDLRYASPRVNFLVLRETATDRSSQILLVQICGWQRCGAPGHLRKRADSFRSFVETGELVSP